MKEITEESSLMDLIRNEESLLLFLYTPLCGTCKRAEQMLIPLEEVLRDVQMVKVNANIIPEFMQREKVTSVPCLKVFQDGENIKTIYAFHSLPSLIERIYPLLQNK